MSPAGTTGTVQLNVRMDRELRDAGTAALESKGLSPSEFVRALWQKAARRGPSLDQVVHAAQDAEPTIAAVEDRPAGYDPVDRGQLLYAECLSQLGLDADGVALSMPQEDYDEMIGDAISAKWEERGLRHG